MCFFWGEIQLIREDTEGTVLDINWLATLTAESKPWEYQITQLAKNSSARPYDLLASWGFFRGRRKSSWLRHWATSRKVVGSIPDGVIGNFQLHNPFGRDVALGSTQPLTEMSTRDITRRVKAAGVWGWQPFVLNSGSINLLETCGPVTGL